MAKEQTALSFGKGITNVPGDATCDDNALEECMGMVYEDGEHRVVQKPKMRIDGIVNAKGMKFTAISTILFVHKFNNKERFVGHGQDESGNDILCWGTSDNRNLYITGVFATDAEGNNKLAYQQTSVTAIGKTLIVKDTNGLHYYLWTEDAQGNTVGSYDWLGDTFPRPVIDLKLSGRNDDDNRVDETLSCEGMLTDWNGKPVFNGDNGREAWKNLVVGLYSKLKKEISRRKLFYGSFCVRAALELYDGTYYHIGNPIFMLNHFSTYGMVSLSNSDWGGSGAQAGMELFGQRLEYRFSQDYARWSDIVKNVVLFVTDQAELFDSTDDPTIKVGDNTKFRSYFMCDNGINRDPRTCDPQSGLPGGKLWNNWWVVYDPNPDSELDKLVKEGVYYKLCDIGTQGDGQWHDSGERFDKSTIENLTTQEQLGEDDFYSHCPLVAGQVYSYNSRLNLANVFRGFFAGFDNFMPYDNSEEKTYNTYVTIATDSGNVIIGNTITTRQKQGLFFYYPDARAKHVVINDGSTVVLSTALIEHPTLNGAYYWKGITLVAGPPAELDTSGVDDGKAEEHSRVTANAVEYLANTIITSEVNNPFVFKAAGYNNVGNGEVIGLSSITQALSQGQFGQYPLLVFTSDGIWAMSVAATGYFSAAHPMSREVCNNPKSITQTDGAVYFSSEKGLMVVVGSEVRCVSQQFSGRANGHNIGTMAFQKYLKGAFIAYDYRDSLLWIFNNERYCWIYSIKSGTFARYDFGQDNTIGNVVPDYPDYLLQSGGKVYSLLNRPDINHDGETVGDSFVANTYDATIVTRPMKFENALALKSIRQIRNVHYMEGRLRYRLFASNDLKRWIELKSLRGMAWKYFKMRFDFTDLKATDRFAGTVVVTDERNTNKLR